MTPGIGMQVKNSRSPVIITAMLVMVALLLSAAGCRQKSSPPDREEKGWQRRDSVEIVYVNWASERASANVVKTVIEEKLDRECTLLSVSLIAMWQSIAEGDQDGMVAAWLPSLQARYLEKYGSEVVDLGPNLEGTKIGLVVPSYVEIDSIPQLKRRAGEFGGKIIGIDPHAGIMETTKEAMKAYGLSDFSLVTGSGSTMSTALGNAIEEKRWIVVTGWTPHWKFAKYDLKYLEDPKNIYGDEERIHTIVRRGLQREMPEVYSFLDRFYWQPADMEEVMLMATDSDTSYLQAARRWVDTHEELVHGWIEE